MMHHVAELYYGSLGRDKSEAPILSAYSPEVWLPRQERGSDPLSVLTRTLAVILIKH